MLATKSGLDAGNMQRQRRWARQVENFFMAAKAHPQKRVQIGSWCPGQGIGTVACCIDGRTGKCATDVSFELADMWAMSERVPVMPPRAGQPQVPWRKLGQHKLDLHEHIVLRAPRHAAGELP